jgi:hypothetical protein
MDYKFEKFSAGRSGPQPYDGLGISYGVMMVSRLFMGRISSPEWANAIDSERKASWRQPRKEGVYKIPCTTSYYVNLAGINKILPRGRYLFTEELNGGFGCMHSE